MKNNISEIPIMPKEYVGEYTTKTKYTTTTPRKWTKKEEEWCLNLRNEGYSYKDIAKSVGRSHISVSIKLKRLSKADGSYNSAHIIEKDKINDEFISYLKPKSILDVYCGDRKVYTGKADIVVNNDINRDIEADYNLDALKLLCLMYYKGEKFDFIDLDPFGSASECFDLALKMADEGIAVTFGELGHKRFKRLDYVRRHYGIDNLEDFTTDNLISKLQDIAMRNKKKLTLYKKCEWNGISRAWFEIEDYKITEQWDKEEKIDMKKAVKIYYASPFFSKDNSVRSAEFVNHIREHFGDKVQVYLPQENDEINDKSDITNIVTDVDISQGDNFYLKDVDILIADLDGVEIDSGVSAEIGYIAGRNDLIRDNSLYMNPTHIIGFTTDMRINETTKEAIELIKNSDDDFAIEFIDSLKQNNLYRNRYTVGLVLENGDYINSYDDSLNQIIHSIQRYIDELK